MVTTHSTTTWDDGWEGFDEPLDSDLQEMDEPMLGAPDKAAIAIVLAGVLLGGGMTAAAGGIIGLYVAAAMIVLGTFISPLIGLSLVLASLQVGGLADVIPKLLTGTKILGLCVMFGYLPRLFFMDFPRHFRSRTLRWMLVLPLWGLLIVPLADNPLGGFIYLSTEVQIAGLAVLVAGVPRNLKQLKFLCLISLLAAGSLGLYGSMVVQKASDLVADGRLQMGSNPNGVAIALGTALFSSAIVWHGAGKKTKILIVFLDLFIVAGIGLTNSRGTWVSIVMAMVLGSLLARGVSMRTRMTFIVVMFGVGAVAFALVLTGALGGSGDLVARRLGSMFSEEAKGARTTWIWPHYLEVVASNPLMGGGPGKLLFDRLSTHNDYLMIMAEKGLVGLAIFLCMLVTMFLETWRNRDEWLRITCVMLAVYALTVGLTHNTFMSKPYGASIGLIAAMVNLGFCEKRQLPAADHAGEHPPSV